MEGLYFHCSLSLCVCVCVCVCVSLSVCVSVSEQNSSKTNAPIWKWFLLNDCLLHLLRPYWNRWARVKVQGHSDAISIFLHNILLTSLHWISALRSQSNLVCYLYMPLVNLYLNFMVIEIRMMMTSFVTWFKLSQSNCPYLKFYWTYKNHTW